MSFLGSTFMRFMWPLLCLGVAAGAYWFAQATDDDKVPEKKEYVVGVLYDYKPFSYLDASGQRTGFDVEIAGLMCRHLKLRCRIEAMPFYRMLDAVRDGKLDILVAGVWETEERRKVLAFSDSYYRSRSFFITRHPELRQIDASNVNGLMIGVIAGSNYEASLRRFYTARGALIVSFPTHADLTKAILNSEVDAILVAGLPGYALLKSPEGKDLCIGGWYENLSESADEAKLAVAPEMRALLPKINDFLLYIQASGQYQELSLRYFPFMNY